MSALAMSIDELVAAAIVLVDGGRRYLYLPGLPLPPSCVPASTDVLLCLDERDGYPTRLFLAGQIVAPGKSPNWNGAAHIMGRNWVAASWSNVLGSQPPLQILLAHLDAFR